MTDVATTHAPKPTFLELVPEAIDGISFEKQIELKLPEDPSRVFTVKVRPLRHSEAQKIQTLLSRDMEVKHTGTPGRRAGRGQQEIKIDTGKAVGNRYEAQLQALVNGLVTPGWTKETIDARWPSSWVETAGNAVMELSGISVPSRGDEKNDEEDQGETSDSFPQ